MRARVVHLIALVATIRICVHCITSAPPRTKNNEITEDQLSGNVSTFSPSAEVHKDDDAGTIEGGGFWPPWGNPQIYIRELKGPFKVTPARWLGRLGCTAIPATLITSCKLVLLQLYGDVTVKSSQELLPGIHKATAIIPNLESLRHARQFVSGLLGGHYVSDSFRVYHRRLRSVSSSEKR